MKPNPLYFNLKTNPDLLHKTTTGKSYSIIPLGEGLSKSLVFRGKTYLRDNQHCSVYEYFSPSDRTQSPIHYTGVYFDSDRKKITLHGFYDECGNYLLAQLRYEGSKNTETLSPDEELVLKRLVKSEATSHLETLFENLFAAQKKAESEKRTALNDLEQESHKGLTREVYLKKLKATIQCVEHANNLNFFPNYSISNFLNRYLASQKQSRRKAKPLVTSPVQTSMPEMKEISMETSEFAGVVASTSNISSAVKPPVDSTESLEDLSEKELYLRLDQCPLNSLNRMLIILNAIDNCKLKTRTRLITACEEGDLKTVKALFNESLIDMTHELLSNAVFYNHQEIFAFIYSKSKFRELIKYVQPSKSTSPTESNVNNQRSFLSYALGQDNLVFFKQLLEKYKVEPNLYRLDGFPLLTHIIQTHQNPYPWIESLLAAKADPEVKANSQVKRQYAPENKTEDQTPISEIKPLDVATIKQQTKIMELLLMAKAIPSQRHVIAAISLNYPEGLNLLLEHKADPHKSAESYPLGLAVQEDRAPIVELLFRYGVYSPVRDSSQCTALSEVSHVKNRVVNKEILAAFISAGHSIDERQGPDQTTGLFYQCFIGNLDGVKKFLELGANPNLPNTMKTAVSSIKVTPLGIAVAKGYPAIAEEILKYKPSSEVIQGAFALCHLSCKDILIEACNREAIVAFKAKQYNKAKDLYLKALEHMQESLSYSVRYNLGVCLLEKGEEKNALEVFSDLKMKLTSAKINAALLAKVETRITQLTNDSAPICRTPR